VARKARRREGSFGTVAVAGAFFVALAACAGAPPRERSVDDRYRDIQRAEAVVARSHALVVDQQAECAPACRAGDDARGAAGTVCNHARRIGDADSSARCSDARASVAELSARLGARCACSEARVAATAERP